MSSIEAFRLRFLAPLRLGASARDAGDATRDLPSDTLSAALVVAAAELYGDRILGKPLGAVASDPPWIVSSLLPWVAVGDRVLRFFPRPVHLALGGGGARKAYRKVAYVSPGLLANSSLTPQLSRCGFLAAAGGEVDGAFSDVVWHRRAARPSVMVDRFTGAPNLFHLEEVAMGMDARAGVWALVRTEKEDAMRLVRSLLAHLAESGIGADRARGCGRFEVLPSLSLSSKELTAPAPARLLLGYASPDGVLARALRDERARYAVVRREGRAHGARGGLGHARKSLRLLEPGSVVPDCGPVVGQVRDVTPDAFKEHGIWRDGRTIAWPLSEVPS